MPTGIYDHSMLRGRPRSTPPWNKGKGEYLPKEVRERINESKRGKLPWNKGIKGYSTSWKGGHHSEKTKEKLREQHLDKPLSENHKKKIRTGVKRFRKEHPYSKELVKKMLRRRTPSGLEAKMISIIEKLQLPYKFVGDGKFFIENKNPDFINCNGEKIAIEVFNKFQKQKFRDNGLEGWKQERQTLFNKYGWKIIFLDETRVNEKDVSRILGED